MTQSAQQNHPQNLAEHSCHTWFSSAIAEALPGATMNAVAHQLGQGVTWNQVRGWRRGLAKPPQWVIDKLGAILGAQAARKVAIAQSGTAGPGKGGDAGKVALARYRVQRALEREKGAPQGAPSQTGSET